METSLLSPKFQVVIPKEIRQALGLKPGQRISFIEKGGHIELRPVLNPQQLIGYLKEDTPLEFERDDDDFKGLPDAPNFPKLNTEPTHP